MVDSYPFANSSGSLGLAMGGSNNSYVKSLYADTNIEEKVSWSITTMENSTTPPTNPSKVLFGAGFDDKYTGDLYTMETVKDHNWAINYDKILYRD